MMRALDGRDLDILGLGHLSLIARPDLLLDELLEVAD
jgi:hypothetical protein